MNPKHEIIVRVLAATDALLMPEPGERGDLTTIRWQHAERWRKSGLPFKGAQFCPGMSTKTAGALLSSLEADGLICGERGASRRVTIKLTFAGHTLARDLIDWPAIAMNAWTVLDAMQRDPKKAAYCDLTPWWVAGDLLKTHREELLWLLGAGWAVADTDGRGIVMLSITPAGKAITKKPPVKFAADADDELKALYAETYQDALCGVPGLEKLDPRDIRVLFLKPYSERSAAK